MTVPASPKRTALLAAARERILVLDGAMGTMIQDLQFDEAAFRGERFTDFHRDLRGNNDLLILTQPKAIEDIHAEYLRAGADIVATNTFSSTSIAQADYDMSDIAYELNRDGAKLARAAAERVSGGGRQAALRRRRAGSDQPHRLDLAGRVQPRLPRRHLRRTAQVLWRTDQRAARRRRRRAAGRNHLRHAERQGGALRHLRNLRGARHRRARDGVRHHHRQVRPPAVGPDAGSVLEFGAARQPVSIGFNCALGAEDLRAHIADIGRVADTLVCAYPNAGLPNEFGGYDESPEYMARPDRRVRRSPASSTSSAAAAAPRRTISPRLPLPSRRTSRASIPRSSRACASPGLEPFELTPAIPFVNVGERTNVTGSARFRKLVTAGDYTAALRWRATRSRTARRSSTSTWTKACSIPKPRW